MKKNIFLGILAFLSSMAVILFLKSDSQNSPQVNVPTEPPKQIYVGTWVGGFWDNETKKMDINPLKNFEKNVDKKMAITSIYSEWEYLSNKRLLNDLNTISGNGWVPMVSANPYFFDDCPEGKDSLYKTIASGKCDAFLRNIAKNLRDYRRPILFRFAWEMNLPDMYWSVDYLKSSPDEFVEAWRHMHTIFKEEHVANVEWVLSFNQTNSNSIPYARLYPGDDYVDWVAIDGYNWGDTQDWSGWNSFQGVFQNSYNELTAITKKPVMLSEFNSAPSGGNKAEWLQDALSAKLVTNFPQVEAIIFFNENKMEGESVDWRIERSPDYINAVKKGLQSDMFKSSYP